MVDTDSALHTSARPQLRRRDHVLTVVFGLWMVIGLFLDGWAHDNGKPESFFTPWHAVLYSGFIAAGIAALLVTWRSRRPGVAWRDSLPQGHGVTLLGLSLFAVGAVGDLVWHEVLGIEVGVEALLSPTHLLLLVGGLVALSGPFRSAWRAPRSEDPTTSRAFLPTVLSLVMLTAIVAFFLLYLSPFSNDAAGHGFERIAGAPHEHPSADLGELQQLLGVASILMTSVILAVPAFMVVRRWGPPRGTFVVLFGATLALFVGLDEFAHPALLLVGPIAGVVVEVVLRRAPALVALPVGMAALWLSYFGLYALQTGAVQWSAELWAGTTFLAALLTAAIGLLTLPLPGYARDPGDQAGGR